MTSWAATSGVQEAEALSAHCTLQLIVRGVGVGGRWHTRGGGRPATAAGVGMRKALLPVTPPQGTPQSHHTPPVQQQHSSANTLRAEEREAGEGGDSTARWRSRNTGPPLIHTRPHTPDGPGTFACSGHLQTAIAQAGARACVSEEGLPWRIHKGCWSRFPDAPAARG